MSRSFFLKLPSSSLPAVSLNLSFLRMLISPGSVASPGFRSVHSRINSAMCSSKSRPSCRIRDWITGTRLDNPAWCARFCHLRMIMGLLATYSIMSSVISTSSTRRRFGLALDGSAISSSFCEKTDMSLLCRGLDPEC